MRKPLFFTMFLLCGISLGSAYEILKRGQEGANISISCNYTPEHESNIKTFLKGFSAQKTTNLIQTKKDQGTNIITKGRYSIYDDPKNTIFTVTIYNLTLEDTGTYWCEFGTLGKPKKTKVSLEVDKDPLVISKPKLSTSSLSTNSSTATSTSNATKDTSVCTRRTTSPQGSKSQETLLYSVVALGVLLLLVVALGLLLFFRQRHRQDKMANRVYEEIQLNSHQTDHQSDGVHLTNLLSGTDQTGTSTIDSPYSLLTCHAVPDLHNLSLRVNESTEKGTVTNTIYDTANNAEECPITTVYTKATNQPGVEL